MPTTDTVRASEIEGVLERLVHHTLEVMCFADAERLPSPPPMQRTIQARVDFWGSRAGHLQLEIESRAAGSLAAAFLGVEPWHPSLTAETGDAIGELARVLCGRLVTSLDPSAPFEIKSAPGDPHEPAETIRQAFRVAGGTLRITLQIS